jgi:hypothetical protein
MSALTILRSALALVMLGAVCAPAVADDTGFAYMHDLRKERGRTCFVGHYHYGNGSGRSKRSAKRDAIRSWVSFTAFEYGSDWARWRRARSKRMGCTRGGKGYNCQVEARPCR